MNAYHAFLYVSAIGSIIYVMIYRCPNILHVVIVVHRFMRNLKKVIWHVMKWTLHYLIGTTYIGSVYNTSSSTRSNAGAFIDLDYTCDLDRMRSLIGYVFTLLGYAISQKTILQSIIALFITKAEYMTLIGVVKKAL